jgi:hypothetical protein
MDQRAPDPSKHVEPGLDLAVLVKVRIKLYPHFPKAFPLYPQRPELLELFANVMAFAHHVLHFQDGVGRNVTVCDLH